ncbi:inorganic phosphate transporter [Carboxylicivirga linearis]|uniref:Phosphate transporter n=1 Tax=Carboxylicivirga linearis TaxID=1628157 RepID=A0ABS5JPT4_9BACT|nr:inorganic phosphate transporter [Carboxylicivirga linearis]MBS2096777.1 inorganic phosphate transporter [Carboxylicivirga linearis]
MTFIWIAVILLGLMAVADLIVGVSNDAVNFLNAAIGSRVAQRRVVYWIAATGIIMGVFLSVGMMEVARKGVIYPSSFVFTDLMVVFIAVMLTDIILIDGFNTLGFPTSTTIAVVFELLGGALALTFIKKGETQIAGAEVQNLINTDRAFVILAGIVLSIFLAFIVGMVVQFITRMIFTFNYKQRFKVLFALVGGVSITAIVFLIAKKALGGSVFGDDQWFILAQQYLPEILFGVFALSTFIFLFLGLSFNIDIPRIVVLFGTFALAMSFAANDLVNFIGLPLASIESLKVFLASGTVDPDTFRMDFLSSNVIEKDVLKDFTYMLILAFAAVVMIITMFYSRKAKGVTETEVYLGRQSEGYERFEPSYLSKVIVRNFLQVHNALMTVLPKKAVRFLDSRYKRVESVESSRGEDGVMYFDTLRASVNLVVASILISIGTYMRVPLSTTFVVFMVAMGSSLADQAWGRESAVYRVSGVLSIIGGWFFTACLAFIGAFVFAYIIWYGSWPATIIATALVIYILYRTRRYYNQKLEEKKILKEEYTEESIANMDFLIELGGDQIKRNLLEASKIYTLAIQGFMDSDMRQLGEANNKADKLRKYARNGKSQMFYAYSKMNEDGIDSGQYFIQAFDYLTELVNCLMGITKPLYIHFENHHKGLTTEQQSDVQELLDEVSAFFNHLVHVEKEQKFGLINDMLIKQNFLLGFLEELRKNQIKRIQTGSGRTRISILYLDMLAETKNILLYSINLIKSHRDFIGASR